MLNRVFKCLLNLRCICFCSAIKDYYYSTILQIKSNLSLHSLYYAEACYELAGPIFASSRQGNAVAFEVMSQRWRTVGNTVPNLNCRDLNVRPPATETNALTLDRLVSTPFFWQFFLHHFSSNFSGHLVKLFFVNSQIKVNPRCCIRPIENLEAHK